MHKRTPPSAIQLQGGGELAYACYGTSGGTPVFHFHGHPGSRLEGKLADRAARRLDVRLISVDRPGMGYSTFQPQRNLLDWAAMVVELADALRIDRFAVQGASGGGPYALACAFRIPERLTACGVIAGLGSVHELGVRDMMLLNRVQFTVARRAPLMLRPLFWAFVGRNRRYLNDPEAVRRLAARLSQSSEVFGGPDLAEAYMVSTLEAFRQGAKGPAYDARLYARPWGFRLADIELPVYLWHGEQDRHVPIGMARAVAQAIPHCRAKFFSKEDHLTVILRHLHEVLETMRDPDTMRAA